MSHLLYGSGLCSSQHQNLIKGENKTIKNFEKKEVKVLRNERKKRNEFEIFLFFFIKLEIFFNTNY